MGDKTDGARRKALAQQLKAMFRNVEQRPIPAELRKVLDQLEAGDKPPRERSAEEA